MVLKQRREEVLTYLLVHFSSRHYRSLCVYPRTPVDLREDHAVVVAVKRRKKATRQIANEVAEVSLSEEHIFDLLDFGSPSICNDEKWVSKEHWVAMFPRTKRTAPMDPEYRHQLTVSRKIWQDSY